MFVVPEDSNPVAAISRFTKGEGSRDTFAATVDGTGHFSFHS